MISMISHFRWSHGSVSNETNRRRKERRVWPDKIFFFFFPRLTTWVLSSASWGNTDVGEILTQERCWDIEVMRFKPVGKALRADLIRWAPLETWPFLHVHTVWVTWVTCSLHTCLRDCANQNLRSVNTTNGHAHLWLNRIYSAAWFSSSIWGGKLCSQRSVYGVDWEMCT